MSPSRLLTVFLLLLAAPSLAAAEPPVYQRGGVALGGTDTVAYFTEGTVVPGQAAHSVVFDGATWHFASAEHRALFLADPGRYAPQYGGWCAYAAAKGAKAPTDPQAWSIVDGRLYLNYSPEVRGRWLGDPPGFIAAADAAWPTLRDQ